MSMAPRLSAGFSSACVTWLGALRPNSAHPAAYDERNQRSARASQHPTLPLQLTVGKPEPSGEGFSLSLSAEIPVKLLQSVPGNEGSVARAHVYVSIFDRNGQPVQFAQFVETMKGVKEADDRSLVVTRSIRLPKGTWKVFITFRDEVNDSVGIARKEISL